MGDLSQIRLMTPEETAEARRARRRNSGMADAKSAMLQALYARHLKGERVTMLSRECGHSISYLSAEFKKLRREQNQ